ncbi:MAG: glycosyltransferase [Candidatus Krumholzibacteriia bacterium]
MQAPQAGDPFDEEHGRNFCQGQASAGEYEAHTEGTQPLTGPEPRAGEPAAPLRIAVIASTLANGGAEEVTAAVCEGLRCRGHRIAVFCAHEPGIVGERLADAGVAVTSFVATRRADPLNVARWGRRLASFRPDVAYFLDHSNVLLPGRLAARLVGVRGCVVAVHRTWRADGATTLSRADRSLTRLTDAYIAIGQAHALHLARDCGVPRRRLSVVPNGVDTDRFHPPAAKASAPARRLAGLPPEGLLLAMVARLSPEKNHLLTLHALADPRAGDWRLVLVGDGPLRHALPRLAEALKLTDRCHWLGERRDVEAILPCCDALVLSSHARIETAPLAVLEAMACGLPVIASNVGCVQEMVLDGTTGIVVPPGDLAALRAGLACLAGDEATRRRLGQAGRARVVGQFSQTAMVEATERILIRAAHRLGSR